MPQPEMWQLLSSTMALDHQWCQVRRDTVRLPGGNVIDDFFVVIRPEIALVMALTPDQEVVMVRQYRHGVQKILLELPGGSFNPDREQGADAVIRELQEETGYQISQPAHLATFYDNPSKDTNQVHLFLAENARQVSEPIWDITEQIEIELVPVDQLIDKVATGEICVAGSVAAIWLGLQHLSTLKK